MALKDTRLLTVLRNIRDGKISMSHQLAEIEAMELGVNDLAVWVPKNPEDPSDGKGHYELTENGKELVERADSIVRVVVVHGDQTFIYSGEVPVEQNIDGEDVQVVWIDREKQLRFCPLTNTLEEMGDTLTAEIEKIVTNQQSWRKG